MGNTDTGRQRDSESDAYAVGQYDPDDRESFQALFETVFDQPFSAEMFEWKFERNPYLSHVPILLAEANGEIVGARGFLARRVRAGDRIVVAPEATDAMVHPDHRHQGVYARLVESTVERYADSEATLRFSFPNRLSLPGTLKQGARLVGTIPMYYRLQNPAACLESSDDALSTRLARRIGGPLARGYLGARDRIRSASSDGVVIRRHTEIPATDLGALYERSAPEVLHTIRDEEFYRWRFDNPEWDYDSYTAVQGGQVVGGMVLGTGRMNGAVVTRIADVLPIGRSARTPALAGLLETALPEYEESDLIAAFGQAMPPALLKSYGFLSDHRLPLSRVTDATPMVVDRLSHDRSEWKVNGFDPTEQTNWLLSYSDWDTA
jgi:GNAT superfamily N-acetyltransferase